QIFFHNFGNWDAGHFLAIAQNGYTSREQYAFFPLYPLLISLLNEVGFNILAAGMVLSFIFTALDLIFLVKLLKLDFSESIVQKTLIFLLIFPASFYLFLPYSESLFLLLAVLSFYFYKKRNYPLSFLFASLSSITRLAGLAVILALWADAVFKDKKLLKNKQKFIIFLAPLGFLAFCLFLKIKTGDPLYFLIAERDWQRILSIPGISIADTLLKVFTPNALDNNPSLLINLLFTVLGLGLSIRTLIKLNFSYGIYSLASVAIPVLSTSLTSMTRFLLAAFPIFINLALIEEKYRSNLSKAVFLIFKFFCVLLLIVYLISFFNGYGVS
ncbi:MAG: mannosyltransferase family protein, partial [Candidatus Paceibacterales bacterium]